jgi:hypothetical protein
VLRPPTSPCRQLPQEEVRPHQSAPAEEEAQMSGSRIGVWRVWTWRNERDDRGKGNGKHADMDTRFLRDVLDAPVLALGARHVE